jgi:hypothetical protein
MKYSLSLCTLVFLSFIIVFSCKPKKQEEASAIIENKTDQSDPGDAKETKSTKTEVLAKSIKNVSPDTLLGRWLRPDGNYIIQINAISADKKIDAQYFNPKPIKIAKAEILPDENLRIFIEFNDKGYEGSSYDLIYDPLNDALTGKYFQATYGQTYQIGFIRLKE